MDLTAGIPTSTAFDTKPVFGENPWDAEERDYNERVATWRRDQTEKLDAAVLDPDTFFQGADFGTAPDPARAMREATNDSALAFYLDREPDMDTTSMQRAIDRQEAAIRFFDGRGADSEESFHAELVAAATRRKDRGTLFQSMSREAGAAATVAAIDPTAPKAGWPAVRAKLAAMPGFTPETEAALAESYATAQREIQASMDGYRPQLAAVWDAFVNNGDTKTAAADTYAALADPKDRRAFLASLRILADSMPEEKRPEFWRNFSRTFERDLFNYLDSAGTAVVTNTAMLNEVRRSFNDPTYIPTPADVRQREALQTQDAETRRRADFLADVRTIQQENFDPIAWITPEGSWKRVLESGAYHAPGALVTSASVLIPGVGQPAFYAASQEMAYQQFRTTFEGSGMSYEDASAKASTLAPIAAIPQVLAERLQISAFAGRLPVFEKVIAKANASISSRLGQSATRAVATGIEESALEQAQNYIPSFVQDIAHALEMDVPDVEWRNGKDGVLDGFWKDSAEMLVTMLPLAIIGAGRGVIADNQRVSTLAQATDDQLLALGAKPEDVSGFRMAQGFGAQAAAMETMLENADPTAESAQAATTRMENAAIATERARLLGLLPRAEVNAGGWTLSDPETGATIGTASNWMDATRIASAHAQLTEEDNAATVAYIATTFQAAEAATVRGTGEIDEAGRNRRTSFIIDLDTRKTAEQAAAESQEAGARVFSEVNLMEESETGEARGTLVVFGESRTTFEKRQRQTVNKLHQGANVLTLFEEEIHGWRREAHAAGRLNRADDLAILRATDQILGGKSRILPANFDQLSAYDQDVAIDEGIAALAQAEVLRTRKQSGGRFDLAPGMVSKNLSAYARLMDSRAFASFRGFLRAVRSFFGLAMDRAKLLEQGRAADPEFSANLDTYLDNLLGLSQQTDHEQAARDAEAAILDGLEDLSPPVFSKQEAEKAIADGFTYGPVYRFGSPNFDMEKADPYANKGRGFYFWPKGMTAHDALLNFSSPQAGGFRLEDIIGQGVDETMRDLLREGKVQVAYLKHPIVEGGEAFVTSPSQIRTPADYAPATDDTPFSLGNDYRIQHQPHPDDQSIDSLEELFGDDIYGPNAIRYFGVGQDGEREAVAIFRRVRNNPDAPVTIYRVVPDFVEEINPGDWVTISKKAADAMNFPEFIGTDAKGNPQQSKILTKEVTAKEVLWPGDSLLEQGYFPKGDVAFSIARTFEPATDDTPFSLGRDQRNQDSRPIDPNQPGGAKNTNRKASPEKLLSDQMDSMLANPPPIPTDLQEAWEWGKKNAKLSVVDAVYATPDWVFNFGHETSSFYEAGRRGESPEYIVGYRFGPIPESGRSTNWADDRAESGVSMAYAHRRSDMETSALTMLGVASREKTYLAGWAFPKSEWGSDGEIVVLAAKEFRPFNQPPAADSAETSLSLARAAAELEGSALARIRDPKRRAMAMQRIAERMRDLHLQLERIEIAAGGKRLAKSLRREAAVREAMRAEELENDAYARHWMVFSNDDLTKIKEQPVHAHLANPDSPLHGRLMSKSAAIKAHPDLFRLHRAGDYDGADGVSRSVFGGQLMPDQAAQELYDAGLITTPTADAMWDALLKEQAFVSGMKETLAKAKADIAEARRIAKQEANQWLAEQTGTQSAIYSPAEEIRRSLAMLDAILNVVPNEVRGKVGKYAATQLARIGTDKNRAEFLREKLAATDEALGVWLAKQLDREFRELLRRSKPEKTEAGRKPTGKITADIHTLFQQIENAMLLTAAEGEAEALKLEHLAANEEQTTAEQRSHLTLQAEMIRLVADWPNAKADRREAALLEATRLYEGGYMAHRIEVSRKAERREHARMSLAAATGKAGTRPEIEDRRKKDTRSKKARMKSMLKGLLSFEQLIHLAFGKDNADGNNLVEWERAAAYAKHDAVMAADSAVEQLLADLAGSKYKGEELRAKLGKPDAIAIDGHNGRETFSELEAITATLMFRQADGRRHMEGHLNDAGQPVGEWHYNEEMIEEIERQLSPQAKAVRLHLMEAYAAEYDRINSVYRQLYNVNLPRHANYSPLTVAPMQAQSGQTVDPVTGFAYSGAGFTPGALKSRSVSAIAKPEFRDALMTYLGHTRQMEHFIAYAPFAQEAAALLNNRNVGDSIKAASGEQSLALLRGWIDHFGLGGTRDAQAFIDLNKGIGRMSGRVATSVLVGRVSVLAIQSTQLGAALAEMPTGSYLLRFAKLMTGQLGWRTAMKSDFIRRRIEQAPPIVRQALDQLQAANKPSRLKYAMARVGETIAGADALFTAGTYAISYDYHFTQARKSGMSESEAARTATAAAIRSTERVAQPTREGTRSYWEVTAPSLARVSWAFASESRQKLALAAFALAKKSPAEAARALSVTWIAGGVVASLIRAAMRDIRDDEDEEWLDEKNWSIKRLGLSSLSGPFQGIPFLGDIIEGGIYKAAGEYLPEGNLFSSTGRIVDVAKRSPGYLDGERDLDDALRDVETVLTGAAPLVGDNTAAAASLSHIVRDAYAIMDNMLGEPGD